LTQLSTIYHMIWNRHYYCQFIQRFIGWWFKKNMHHSSCFPGVPKRTYFVYEPPSSSHQTTTSHPPMWTIKHQRLPAASTTRAFASPVSKVSSNSRLMFYSQ
jgi:hypothetical protein